MVKIGSDFWSNAILSVGTHYKIRRLTPIELSDGFVMAKKEGISVIQIAEKLDIDNTIVSRLIDLSKLTPKVKLFVDWGSSDTTISFTSASEIAKANLSREEQEIFLEAIIQNSLNKKEVIQILQIKKRSNKRIKDCIEDVLRLRPKIIYKYLYIGTILKVELSTYLQEISQKERNETFHNILNKDFLSNVEWEGRLGTIRFSLVGGESLNEYLKVLKPDYEVFINNLLNKEILND